MNLGFQREVSSDWKMAMNLDHYWGCQKVVMMGDCLVDFWRMGTHLGNPLAIQKALHLGAGWAIHSATDPHWEKNLDHPMEAQ